MLWPYAILLGLVLLPLLPLSRITLSQLAWARDRWLLGLCALVVLGLAEYDPVLAVVAVAALAQWKGPEQMPSVIVYAAIIGEWVIVSSLPAPGLVWLPVLLAIVATAHTGWLVADLILRQPLRGLLGQRTFSGAAIALTLPFTWPYAAPVAVAGLLVSQSWLAWIAGAAGLAMLAPWTLAVSVSLGLIALVPILRVAALPVAYQRPASENTWLDRLGSRGTSIDSLRARLAVWHVLVRHLSWRGLGPGAAQRIITRSSAPAIGHAHCEPLEYVVEYGALGAVALVALVVRIAPCLRLHDPWSAAVVAGAVLMLGSTPARVAQVGGLWWAQAAILVTSQ